MLFKVILAAPEETGLGFEWIEVLGTQPFRFTPLERHEDDGGPEPDRDVWICQNMYIARTDAGLVTLTENDLWEEIYEGIYVEEGTPKKEIDRMAKLRHARQEYIAERMADDCHADIARSMDIVRAGEEEEE
jgi:hypothetical protein